MLRRTTLYIWAGIVLTFKFKTADATNMTDRGAKLKLVRIG